ALAGKLGIDASQTLYVGDDVPDLPLLRRVGFSIAVSNAHDDVKAICDYTTVNAGGFGAVREVCDLILQARHLAKG
ncbi:MAG: HAD hydrolase family protein, partial [Woeseia sp.]